MKQLTWICYITALMILSTLLMSCACSITPRQAKIDYELEKAYLEYSYERDSLIIEFYRTDVIEEDGVRWYTLDSIIINKTNINQPTGLNLDKDENK